MKWKQRIRATIWLGLTWGAAGCAGGLVLARVPGCHSDLPFALLFAALGVAGGVLFSGVLVVFEHGHALDSVPFWRFAAWGGLSGLLLSGIIATFALFRGDDVWAELRLFGPPLALASAACAVGSLALARRAQRRGASDS